MPVANSMASHVTVPNSGRSSSAPSLMRPKGEKARPIDVSNNVLTSSMMNQPRLVNCSVATRPAHLPIASGSMRPAAAISDVTAKATRSSG